MLACALALCVVVPVPAFQVRAEEAVETVEMFDSDETAVPAEDPAPEENNISEEELTITSVYPIIPLPSNWMVPIGGGQEWDDFLYYLKQSTALYLAKCPANNEVLLDASFDTNAVNLEQPGEYTVTITLSLSDYQDIPANYILPDHLCTLTRTVKVSRPEDFELWISKYDADVFVFQYLKKLDSSYQLYTMDSDQKLSKEELVSGGWQLDTQGYLNTDCDTMTVLRRDLEQGHYYYYQIRSEDTQSSIVMLQDNGETYESEGITGNRDGSSDDSGSDDVIQPAPKPPFSVAPSQPEPSEEEPETPEVPDTSVEEPVVTPAVPSETPSQPEISEQPENPAPSEDSTPIESFTEDSDTIYGTRLDLTRKTHGGSASFSKHDIQATLSSDTLDSLDVGNDDSLTVEIKQETSSSVTLSVSKNGEPVTEIPDTQITVPVDGELYSFTVQETGTYELPEAENGSQNETSSAELPPSDPSGGRFSGGGFPIYLGLSALSLSGIFLILRRRIFR